MQKKIASLHFKVANRREDWLYKLAHYFCSITDNVFVEDINFKSWQKGLFGQQVGNSAIGKFINQILPFIAWQTVVYYEKVDKNFTSQECPNCRLPTGKKTLKQRVHNCQYCGVTLGRDVAAAKVIENRGRIAVGQPVNLGARSLDEEAEEARVGERRKGMSSKTTSSGREWGKITFNLRAEEINLGKILPPSRHRKSTCGDRGAGVLQLTLFAAEGTRSELVTGQ